MVRKTLEVFECDKCGADGRRYTILYEEGALILDRCDRHNKRIEALRDEEGEWREAKASKSTFRKSTPEELRQALLNARTD